MVQKLDIVFVYSSTFFCLAGHSQQLRQLQVFYIDLSLQTPPADILLTLHARPVVPTQTTLALILLALTLLATDAPFKRIVGVVLVADQESLLLPLLSDHAQPWKLLQSLQLRQKTAFVLVQHAESRHCSILSVLTDGSSAELDHAVEMNVGFALVDSAGKSRSLV